MKHVDLISFCPIAYGQEVLVNGQLRFHVQHIYSLTFQVLRSNLFFPFIIKEKNIQFEPYGKIETYGIKHRFIFEIILFNTEFI